MKLNCLFADACLPDYWAGHHLPHVQIAVDGAMSFADVRKAIRNELAQGAVAGSSDDARLLSVDCVREDEVKRADALTRAAYAAVNRDVRPAKKGARRAFPNLEKDAEEVCAFFVFREVE